MRVGVIEGSSPRLTQVPSENTRIARPGRNEGLDIPICRRFTLIRIADHSFLLYFPHFQFQEKQSIKALVDEREESR